MTNLRALVLSLLCLGVLPWGAFTRHVEAPARAAVAVSPTVNPVPRSCSIAIPSQSACTPDAVLASSGVAETLGQPTPPPELVHMRDLYRPQMPLDPPKRVG